MAKKQPSPKPKPAPKTSRPTSSVESPASYEAFVKNPGLGFAVPYLHNGQPHDYVPDFIVRLAGIEQTHLVIETTGFDELAEVKAAAARRWVAAVNEDGQYGPWRYETARSVGAVREILDAG